MKDGGSKITMILTRADIARVDLVTVAVRLKHRPKSPMNRSHFIEAIIEALVLTRGRVDIPASGQELATMMAAKWRQQ